MLIKSLILGFATMAFVNAQELSNCAIMVVPTGNIQVIQASISSQISLPHFTKYAVVRIRDGVETPSVEIIQNDLASKELAEQKANSANTPACPFEGRSQCRMRLETPNKVVVQVNSLDRNNKQKFSPALVIIGHAHATLQDNLNLLKEHEGTLGCQWERGEIPKCKVVRRFSFSRKAPEYSIQIGQHGLRGLNALTYAEAKALGTEWSKSIGAPPTPACQFEGMPDSVTCTLTLENGRYVIQYDQLGISSPMQDQDAACERLMASVSSGECGISSPMGNDPCIHPGVNNSPREESISDKYDGLDVHEDGPVRIRVR